MISKTKILKRVRKKRNPEIVETIELAKREGLLDLAKKLSGPKSGYVQLNLDKINELKEDKILIVGKVLGSGEIKRKVSVSALGFSERALEKLKKSGCETKKIKQEIKNNKELRGIKIIG